MWTKPNDGVISTTSPIGALEPGLYFTGAGSSIGTAHISGAAAQIIARFGVQAPGKLAKMLYGSTIDLGREGRDPEVGYGLVDVPRAVGLDR